MKPASDLQALEACYLFAGLPRSDLTRLAQQCHTQIFKKNQSVFCMGDDADGLRILLEGVVRVWISDEDGQELTVALLEQGDSFGEIALFDDLPRTANASALEQSRCLFVPRSAVDPLLESAPGFARQIIHVLCETLRRNTDEMGAIMFRSLDVRLAQKLCGLAASHAVVRGNTAQFNRRFSQTELAKMLGVTREAINKNLTVLARAGLIDTENGLLTIVDVARLAARK